MSAFNQRFSPKEFYGVPLVAAVSVVMAFVFGILTLLSPFAIKFICGPLMGLALGLAAYAFHLGDEWDFRVLMAQAYRDRGGVTSETWTRY